MAASGSRLGNGRATERGTGRGLRRGDGGGRRGHRAVASGEALAPASGTLVKLFEGGHAFGIETDEGVELIVHVGLDTIELRGAGFEKLATEGDRVEAGQPIVRFDLEEIRAGGYDPVTPVVVTNARRAPGERLPGGRGASRRPHLRGRHLKRILDCGPADFERMDGAALLEAIRRSEGRTILCEVLWPAAPLVDGVTNAEVTVAFGADLVLLNMFEGEDLAAIKGALGRPVGVNVEPSESVAPHRRASAENLRRVADADFVVITANPDAQVGVRGDALRRRAGATDGAGSSRLRRQDARQRWAGHDRDERDVAACRGLRRGPRSCPRYGSG